MSHFLLGEGVQLVLERNYVYVPILSSVGRYFGTFTGIYNDEVYFLLLIYLLVGNTIYAGLTCGLSPNLHVSRKC